MACAAGAARTKILARRAAISQDGLAANGGRSLTNSHPLDPLSADEIRQAAAIVRRDRKIGDTWRFASIELKEPSKDALAAGPPGAREAIVVCWDRADGLAHRATVSLTGDKVTTWEDLPGQQPNMTVDEWHECDEMLRAHPAVAEALARRGITDMSLVLTDMWAYGAALVPELYKNRRIGWSDVWYRGSELGNPYAHHVTGLHPVVDLNTMTLLELEDSYEEATGADPEVMGEYLPSLLPMRLREVTPLEISQPEGVGFTLDGHLLSWQNWQLRLGFNHREGLVLNQVAVRDGQRSALGGAPALVRRDGGAVPGRQPGPLPADRVRHRRVGPGLHDHLALAGLRLPGRHHLPGRGGARLPRRAPDHTERDLRPRGGQRGRLEARGRAGRHRGQAGPAARDLLPRHRGELRVPRVLAVLPGRQHRVRGPRDRHPGHLARRAHRAPARPNGTLVDHGHLRAVPPALHRGPARPRRGRGGQHRLRHRFPGGGGRRPRQTRTGWAWRSGAPRCAPSRRGSRSTTGPRSAAGRS